MIGLILLLALATIELSLFFIFYHFKTVNYRFVRNARILILTVMLLLLFFEILTWSFRYYGLLSIVFITIIAAHIKGFNQATEDAQYTRTIGLKRMMINLLCITVFMLPLLVFPEYKPLPTTGEYAVKVSTFVFEDDRRNESFLEENEFRQVGVHAWYPDTASGQTFPLIIYSHGGISLESSNESLFLELASHGYVVFSIGHPYHTIRTNNIDNNYIWIDTGYVQELNRENAVETPTESVNLYQKWMHLRTADINFMIDYVIRETQAHRGPLVFQLIDREQIGIIGHSLGGSAALCIGRNRSDVKAIIALESPYMCDVLGVVNETFVFDPTPYPIPVLHVYTDSTWSKLSTLPQYKQNHLMRNNQESNVLNVHIDGTGHFSLTDLSLTSPFLTRMLNGFSSTKDSKEVLTLINEQSLEFLNKYFND